MGNAHWTKQGIVARPLDEYARQSRFATLDASAKIIGILAFVLASALLTRMDLVLTSLAASVAVVVVSRLPAGHILKLYLVAVPFILFASLSFFLFRGLESGILMWARASSCVLALIVLASSTETFDMFSGLRRLRVPAVLTTLLVLAHKYIVLLTEELSRMTTARRARGFGGGRSLLDKYSLRVIAFTAGMVLVKSSQHADRVYEGLKSKGFEKDMVGWKRESISFLDLSFIVSLVAISVILLMLQSEVIA